MSHLTTICQGVWTTVSPFWRGFKTKLTALFHEVRRSARPTQSVGHGRCRLGKERKTRQKNSQNCQFSIPLLEASPLNELQWAIKRPATQIMVRRIKTRKRDSPRAAAAVLTAWSSSKDFTFNHNSSKRHYMDQISSTCCVFLKKSTKQIKPSLTMGATLKNPSHGTHPPPVTQTSNDPELDDLIRFKMTQQSTFLLIPYFQIVGIPHI